MTKITNILNRRTAAAATLALFMVMYVMQADVEARNASAKFEHEATTTRLSDDQLFYVMQRGLSREEAELWSKVARTVKPLAKAAKRPASEQLAGAKPDNTAPPPKAKSAPRSASAIPRTAPLPSASVPRSTRGDAPRMSRS